MSPNKNSREIYNNLDKGDLMTVVHVSENICHHGREAIEEMKNEVMSLLPPQHKKHLIQDGLDALAEIEVNTELYATFSQKILRTRNDVAEQARHKQYAKEATNALLAIYDAACQWNRLYSTTLEMPKMSSSPFARKAPMFSCVPLYSSIMHAIQPLQKARPAVSVEQIESAMKKSRGSDEGKAL